MRLFNIFVKVIIRLIPKSYKKQAELSYWSNLVKELTRDCKGLLEKEEKLMRLCYEITYRRYKKVFI